MPYKSEVVYVNDGSTDESIEILKKLKLSDPRVAIVDLSRNFGKGIAMTAGIDHSCGDAVVVIDADLQDPPELIPKLITEWEQGFDVVYAQRTGREGESSLKKATAYAFYRVIQNVSRVAIPEDTGDYRLLSRRAVRALVQLREQHRFMKGLFAWIGFPQKKVLYTRLPRYAGKTKWNYWRLCNFALEGITSFTIAPLKIATYLGLLMVTDAREDLAGTLGRGTVFPNPSKTDVRFTFRVGAGAQVEAAVYDAAGRRLRTLVRRTFDSGTHTLGWDGRDESGDRQPSGVYFVVVRAGTDIFRYKLVRTR